MHALFNAIGHRLPTPVHRQPRIVVGASGLGLVMAAQLAAILVQHGIYGLSGAQPKKATMNDMTPAVTGSRPIAKPFN